MFSRLSSRLTAVIVGVAILPLVLVVGVLLWNARTNQRDAAQVLQDETSKRLAQEIETFITSRPRDLRLITEVHGWVDLSPDEQRVVLSELLAFDEFFEELVLLDARGHELIRESKRDVVTTTLGNRADQDAFRIPFEQQIDYYSPVQVNEETGELLMTIGIPLVDLRTGDVANVLVGDFRFKAVTELLQAEEFQPGEDVYVVLVEDDAPTGEALVDNPELVIAHKNPSVVLGKATVEIDDIDGTTTGLHGDEVIVGLSSFTVGDQAFAVVAELTTDEAYRKSNEALQTTSIMAFVVLVLVAAGGYYFSQRIARPIGELATVARQIGGGDLNVKAKSGGSYEIATLSDTFNSMTAQLASVIGSLEDRVAARTQDLFLTLEVGQLAARIYQQAELLPRVADFIRERFDLYYTQIYLVDEAGRYAYLEAGTGEVGRQLLERGHRLDLSETSIVARTYQSQRPVLVMDTDASDIHRPNPLLPETRSEVAIPLIVGDQTLGVLDMQAREAEIFHEDNLPVFEAMANQLAAALRSAQAYEETQIAIKRADEINRRLTGEAWTGYLARLTRDKAVGYRYDLQEVESIDASLLMQDTSNGGKLVRQPVLLRDEPIGTIQIVEDAARDWSADDLALVEAVADRVALALEQFRAFDETQQALNETAVQAQRLSLLNDLAAEISAAETLADVYRIVAVRTDEVLTSDRASIAMLTPDETRFEIYGLDGERGAIPLGAQLPRAGTWVGEVIDGNRARVLPDMAVVPYLEAQQLVKQGLHSSLNAPLVVHGRPIGTLNVARAEINAYSQRDTDLLTQIASLLSAQIENRGLLEQAQKRAAEMQTVAEVGTEASSALDPDELLWKVVNLVKERFDLYHAHIYLVDDTGERLILTAGAGDVGQKMVERRRGIALTHEHSLVARAARDRQGVIVNDVTLAPDFLPNPMLPNTRAEMAIPMVVGTQLLGVLDVQSTEVGRFTDEDLRVKGTLAAQIATAVQNARLFTEAQSRLAIIESSDNFIAMADMEANLLYINPAGARLVGYDSVDEFMAKVTQNSAIHPPEGLERIEREAMPEVFGDSGFWRGENTILHRDGTIIEVEQALFVLYEEDGTPRNIVSIMTDIRQRKAAQEELDRERRTLQTVLTNLPVGVFMADAATGSSLLANDAALDMLGRGLDPASSTNQLAEVYDAYKFGTDELYPVDQMPLVRGMSGESVQIDDMEIRRPDGKRILLEVTGAPITDAQGNVTASLAVFNDITERRRAEEERQQFLIETQARYEAGRQLVAATNYEETLRAITRYCFRDGAVVGSLYAVELDEAGEPEWIEAIANVKAHDDVFINSPVGSRYYVPELLFTQLWIVDAERPQLINDITSDERVTAEMREVLRQSGHRAMLTLPLTLGGQWIGVANFFWEQPHMFTDSEERFYAAMSGQMASVLQSMRLLQVTEKRAGEMATVAEVGAEAAASLDANRLLSDVVNLTKERFNLYHAHVYLVNETGRYLQLAAGAGQIGQMMVGTSYRIALDHERSLVARAARSREGVIVDDVTQVDDFLPNPMLPETRSEMAIPMIVGDRVLGVLDVQSNKAAYFDRDDLQVLSTLASQIAVSVNNARLFEDQVAAAHQREALNELSQAMLAAETMDEIYATVTNVLVEQFEMAFARIWTVDPTSQELVLQVSAGLYTHLDGPHSRIPLDSDLKLARIAHQRAPHITNDLLGDPW
ncbi:MAG: GAF domain-containing protein, partial [Anaerolineae bacterium]|nr:GAF domain-containing protein [Anaerolineae bacterium]